MMAMPKALTDCSIAACMMLVSLLNGVSALSGSAAVGPFSSFTTTPGELVTVAGWVKAAREFWIIFGPGGKLHPAYFLEHKGHLVVEGLLLVVIAYLFLQHTFKPRTGSEEPLTEKEIDQLCKEWKPEPLTPTLAEEDQIPTRIITKYDGKHVVADGQRVLNLATFNFLGLANTSEQTATAHATVNKYGVGSCGPRGFYGTIDVHLTLEDELQQFMQTEKAVIYSYDIATVCSVIPAFANRGDVLVMDECCAYPIQQGVMLSRATVHCFKHNDMADLERVLQDVEKRARQLRQPLNRRFIVVEGIYANHGELCPLAEVVALKHKYKWRLMLEESYSFGVLGNTGRGAAEHWGIPPEQVEVICASMGNALGSVGGFCVGSEEIVEYQRLGGSGYCFSASLPPYLATAASQVLAELRTRGPTQLLPAVRRAAAAMRRELRNIKGLVLAGASSVNDASPVLHLRLANPATDRAKAEQVLQRVSDHLLHTGGVLMSVARYSTLERSLPPPSLRLIVTAELTDADVTAIAAAVTQAAKECL